MLSEFSVFWLALEWSVPFRLFDHSLITILLSALSPGNCGCAFLQIDVGRSSWAPDRPFVTLLPATMLMSPTESKEEKNRCGVRMFRAGKEGGCAGFQGQRQRTDSVLLGVGHGRSLGLTPCARTE